MLIVDVFSTIIFCHQIGKFLVICTIFTCLHLDLPYEYCRMVRVSLEMCLPTRPLWGPTYLPDLKWA